MTGFCSIKLSLWVLRFVIKTFEFLVYQWTPLVRFSQLKFFHQWDQQCLNRQACSNRWLERRIVLLLKEVITNSVWGLHNGRCVWIPVLGFVFWEFFPWEFQMPLRFWFGFNSGQVTYKICLWRFKQEVCFLLYNCYWKWDKKLLIREWG